MSNWVKIFGGLITSISIILVLREFNIEGWETSAFITAMFLLIVLGFLFKQVFGLDFIPSFTISSILTFLIFVVISIPIALVMLIIFIVMVFLCFLVYG